VPFTSWQELCTNDWDKSVQEGRSKSGNKAGRERTSIASILSRTFNAKSDPLDAVWDSSNNVPCTDRADKVKLLDAHWGIVLGPKECSPQAFDELLQGYRTSFPEVF